MDLSVLSDPIFRLPFVVGLLLAIVLPLLGALLMLRDEWLAALGYAHLAAAGALLGLAFGLPALAGGVAAAGAGGAAKGAGGTRGNAFYGFMILGGWAALLLLAANTGLGEQLGHALIEGQLYFAGPADLLGAALLALAAGAGLPWLMPRLLRARLLPQHEVANALPARRWHLGFDLLAAAGMAVGTASLGLMAAFALVLAPAWLAFRRAPSWRWTLVWCAAVGSLGYVVAFGAALVLDQPFAPVLVAVLLATAAAGGSADLPRQAPRAEPSSRPSAHHPPHAATTNHDHGEPSP
jgi:zinc transport system permease protein